MTKIDINKKYQTILADPPWNEQGGGKIKRGADRHYPLMKTKDINIDTTNPENWTDEKWVAAYLNIKPNTLRKQRSVGINYVPYSKIGGSVRYNKLKVMEYAESKGRKPNDR